MQGLALFIYLKRLEHKTAPTTDPGSPVQKKGDSQDGAP